MATIKAPNRKSVKPQERHVRSLGVHAFPRATPAEPVRYGGFVISTVRRGRVVEEEYSFVEYAPDDFRRVAIGVNPATDHCPCDGHKYGYVCRHVGALRALIAAGKIPS